MTTKRTRFSGLDLDLDATYDDVHPTTTDEVAPAEGVKTEDQDDAKAPSMAVMLNANHDKAQFGSWGALKHKHANGATSSDAVVEVDVGRCSDVLPSNPFLAALNACGGNNTAELVSLPPMITSAGTFGGVNGKYRAVVDRDTGEVLNTTLRSPSYSLVQHRDIADVLHEATSTLPDVNAIKCHVLGKGQSVWWRAQIANFGGELPGTLIDKITRNARTLGRRVMAHGPRRADALAMTVDIVARNSHGGNSIKFAMLATVKACGNLARVTVGGFDCTIAHNSLTAGRVKALRSMLSGAHGKAISIFETFAHLAHVPITRQELDAWAESMYGKRNKDGDLTRQSAEKIEAFKVKHDLGRGAQPMTALGLIAAVTDVETNVAALRPTANHYSPTSTTATARLTEARTNNAVWGKGASRIESTMKYCLSMAGDLGSAYQYSAAA